MQEREPFDPVASEIETHEEPGLRPTCLGDYVGQTKIVEHLSIAIEAARKRGDTLDHVLFCGPPGLGKTTLANIVAQELGMQIRSTSGPVLERGGDLAAIVTNLEPGEVLFIDEIHRLNRVVEEILYLAMEDFKLDIVIGQGPAARTIKIDLPKFTLVGATTRTGLLTSPLRDRFGMVERLEFYGPEDLQQILQRSAKILEVEAASNGIREIAMRSRGTPRIANRLLKRVRDFAQVRGEGHITGTLAQEALAMLEVDRHGFDRMDRKILRTIIEKFDGGPVGVDALAAAVGEESDTVEEVYEPFLLQQGFIARTPRGRVATRHAYEHLGAKFNPGRQDSLFS